MKLKRRKANVPRDIVRPQDIERRLKPSKIIKNIRCIYHRKAKFRMMTFDTVDMDDERVLDEIFAWIGVEYTIKITNKDVSGRTWTLLKRRD